MSPDPRHGTVAGYNRIPCREDCCKLAMARYRKRREWDRMNGLPRIVPTIGARRRIEALNAIGWSNRAIARHAGMADTNMTRVLKGETMTRGLFQRFAETYEALCMQLPTGSAQAISATKNRARRHGWAPPLAWDNIDDPTESPVAVGDVRSTTALNAARLATLRDLDTWGEGVTQACRRLELTQSTLDKWCRRHGLSDLFSRLVAREDYREPTNTFGGAA